jgi:hypothetical protein
MRASIEGRNPVLQERAMASREGAIGRDEINATGKSGVEWAVVFFGEADFDGSQSKVCRETRISFCCVSGLEKYGSLYPSQADDDVWGGGMRDEG